MGTLYFIYSTIYGLDAPEAPNSPYSLTWNLGRYLRQKSAQADYSFRYVNLDDLTDHPIGKDDVVIGHTWWPDGAMNRALDSAAKAKFIIQPYSPGMVAPTERDWLRGLFAKADHLFLVTGPAWWACMETSGYGDWKAKATRLDMAINPALHPFSKRRWNPPGKRAFLAIGTDIPAKGMDFVADLARMGGFKIGVFGSVSPARFQHVPQAVVYGGVDFTPAAIQRVADEYDAFISLARMDANPTALLETAAWGLLPLANRESGYLPNEPFMELRIDDMRFNLEQIDYLQTAPDYALRQRQEAIRREVVERHTWGRFCETVWAEVEQRL